MVHSTWNLERITEGGRNSYRMHNPHVNPPVSTPWVGTPAEAAHRLADALMGAVQWRDPVTGEVVA